MNSPSNISRWILGGLAPALLALLTFLLGAYLFGTEEPSAPEVAHVEEDHAPTTWTCSMHPAVQLPEMGKCPICFMDLIPLVATVGGEDQVSLQPAAAALLAIETRPATRQAVSHAVSMVGRLAIDETRTSMISAWVPGRIDRLFVDSTGIPVRKDDHLAELYSPPLYQAQVELAQARAALARAKSGHAGRVDESLVAAAMSGVNAVEERMRLWGLTEAQIRGLAELDKPTDQITIYAPTGGVVTDKLVHEGHYVETGTPIYAIADLSALWLELQAFESDLPWLALGQKVRFQTDSIPDQIFEGQLTFIDPWIDPKTRTAKLRVEVPNARGRLKPEMFVRAKVHAEVNAKGTAKLANLDGAFSCPMHPNVNEKQPGHCPICEMPLEPWSTLASAFGASQGDSEAGLPLVIPTTAPLITGRRAVVYVQTDGEDGELLYRGREIELGPRAGGMYVVLSGLDEGDLVVARGSFKIDSELELKAQTSWMSSGVWEQAPGEEAPAPEPEFEQLGEAFQRPWNQTWSAYQAVQASLAGDDPVGLASALDAVKQTLEADFGAEDLGTEAQAIWNRDLLHMQSSLTRVSETGLALGEQRARFETFSGAVDLAMQHFGSAIAGPVYRVHCPMAFDNRGADWLQSDTTVNNPYFGAAMLRCGDLTETLWEGVQEAPEVTPETATEHMHEGPMDEMEQGLEVMDEEQPAELPTSQPLEQSAEVPASQPMEHGGEHESESGLEQAPEPEPQPEPLELAPKLPDFGEQLDAVLASYLLVQESLAGDDLPALGAAVASAAEALKAPFNLAHLSTDRHALWTKDVAALRSALAPMSNSGLSIGKVRTHFETFSGAMTTIVRDFDGALSGPVYRVHCPMAFGNQGADWLQADKRVNNPYFGAAMLRCGSVKQTLIEAQDQ